jgi:hypothetical protein
MVRLLHKANHFGLAWESDASTPPTAPGVGGVDFVGPANFREEDTVDHRGMSYDGASELVQ